MSGLTISTAPPKGLVGTAVAIIVLAFIVGLVVWLAPPILLGVLVFPALGFGGWASFGLAAACFVVWTIVLRLLQRARGR